jgi:hypothetical protein
MLRRFISASLQNRLPAITTGIRAKSPMVGTYTQADLTTITAIGWWRA